MAVVMSTFCVVVGLLHTQIQRSAIQILGGGGEDNTPIRGRNRGLISNIFFYILC